MRRKSHDFLVLPHIPAMEGTTERWLRQYVSEGGWLQVPGDAPAYCEGEDWDFSCLCSHCARSYDDCREDGKLDCH